MVQDVALGPATELIPPEVLRHVPGAGISSLAERLYGGTVNSSFRVDTAAGQFVVRLHHPAATGLGANHQREAQLQAVAAEAGLAPALSYVDPGHAFMVMAFVPGPTWAAEDFSRPRRLQLLGRTLGALHKIRPPVVAPFDVQALLAHHFERIVAASPGEQGGFRELMGRAGQSLEACGTHERAKTLIHGDLHHSNLIGIERLYLLDWEYGAVADPLFDLASVTAYYPQAEPHAQLLLDSAGFSGAVTVEMLRHATWLYVLLSYFWYCARRLAGPPDTPDSLAAEQSLRKRLALPRV